MELDFIFSGIKNIFVFAVFLGILVAVHEWGHFITAKKLGVDVEEFALGFGPTLFKKKHDGTMYFLKAIPLGGYVKMAGDERDKCTGKSDEYYSKPPGHRALIVFNGPLVNMILAYVVFVVIFLIGYPGGSTVITHVEKDGAAYSSGIEIGDKIVKVENKKIYGLMDLDRHFQGTSTEPVNVTISRNGQEIQKQVKPTITKMSNAMGQLVDSRDIGIDFLTNKVGAIGEGSPADLGGLVEGDRIVEIQGVQIRNWLEIQSNIRGSVEETISVKVDRDGFQVDLEITPNIVEKKDSDGNLTEVKMIGIGPMPEEGTFRFGVIDSIKLGFREFIVWNQLTLKAVQQMVVGRLSPKETVGGPIIIFKVVAVAAEEGLVHFLLILGIISTNLAVINLFPIIPLDGGHLFLLLIEKIRGKELPESVDNIVSKIGFIFIISLFLFVFYVDFDRIGLIDGVRNWVMNFFK